MIEGLVLKSLSLLLLTAPTPLALPVHDDRQYSETSFLLGAPVVHNGPYRFVGCLPAEAEGLITLFQRTGDVLSKTIIPAVVKPSPDPNQDPFVTFFSRNPRNVVQNVFNDINNGATKTQGGLQIERPNIVCINNSSSPYLGRGLELCDENKVGMGMTHAGQVLLCPRFFNNPQLPDSTVNCPTVSYAKNAAEYADHKYAYKNQFFGIIHELSHIYSPHPILGSYEVFGLNQLVYRQAGFQLNNANNYAFYAVSVYMGCSDYPLRLSYNPFSMSPRELPLPEQMDDLLKRKSPSESTNASVPFNNTIPTFLDDVPSSIFPGVDFDAIQANLTALSY